MMSTAHRVTSRADNSSAWCGPRYEITMSALRCDVRLEDISEILMVLGAGVLRVVAMSQML
jgi:hypothetical protein